MNATIRRSFLPISLIIAVLTLTACAGLPSHEPLQVNVAGIESLPGEGLEMRMMVKLRVQNPNDAPVEFDGVYVKLDVLNKTFASGVSDQRGWLGGSGITGSDGASGGVVVAFDVKRVERGDRQAGGRQRGAVDQTHG